MEKETLIKNDLSNEIEHLKREKAQLLILYNSIVSSLKENRDKLVHIESETDRIKLSIGTIIDEINNTVDNDLSQEHSLIIQQIQGCTSAIMDQRALMNTSQAQCASLIQELQKIKEGKESEEESENEEETVEKSTKFKSIDTSKKKKGEKKTRKDKKKTGS